VSTRVDDTELPRREHAPRLRSDDELFPRRDDLDPKIAEEANALDDPLAHVCCVLTDPAGEDERVDPAARARHRRDRACDAVDEHVDRERRRRTDVAVRAARQPRQPGLVLEGVLELAEGHEPFAQEVHERTRVDSAGAGRHRHPLERGEAHRRVDRPSVADRRDGTAAAEVADDETRHPHPARRPLHREPVEADPSDSVRLSPDPGNCVRRRGLGQRTVERGVEDRDLRNVRQPFAHPANRVECAPVLQRREHGEPVDLVLDRVVDQLWLVERAAVHDAMADGVRGGNLVHSRCLVTVDEVQLEAGRPRVYDEHPHEKGSCMTDDDARLLNAYWRAANYLSVGQIYLLDNPLLREPLRLEHVKPRLLGHWGTTPGLNFLYTHLNRAIRARELDAMFVTGPGHGGPAVVAHAYLEGTYSELYPHIARDEAGLRALFRQFSFPGGIPSHAAPETPGSIHEGGELGYALSHAYGAAFDNPGLLVACVVGDGEAETGPLATSWHSNKFLHPTRDGRVLPILHLNGYKIANPTVLARIPEDELLSLLRGYGHEPVVFTAGFDDEEPPSIHARFAETLDRALDDPRAMIVFRTPKGWTGPHEVDGVQVEGTWRAHQVPLAAVRESPEHLRQLEEWLRSYRPDELFDDDGALLPELAALPPRGDRRMSANPKTNGGLVLRELDLPDFRGHAVDVEQPGVETAEATRVLGGWLRDVVRRNPDSFRIFGPDETASNRLDSVYDVTDKQWEATIEPVDEHLAPEGRVVEMLSEHQCQGWLEGYLLTGRHGLFNCYEAFIHIVDSMFNQHAKWLKVTRGIPWRRPIASLNYLLSSHVWRQDHNGFSHQDPGFIDHVVNKKAEIIRVYLPPDANCLLSVADHCLRSRHYVNVIVAGKQPALQFLSMDDAIVHCTRGIGIWDWASNDDGTEPDAVLACCGDVPTLETLAAAAILRQRVPDLKVRVVNVVDLMRLQPHTEHPHGLTDEEFDSLFTRDKPIVFAYHGYPWLIHRLTYRRTNHDNLHVRGYKEEGTTTTPFDMVMLNDLDRFHLVTDVLDRLPAFADRVAHVRQEMVDARVLARAHAREHGEDAPEIAGWTWRPESALAP
jgi:xylulose-5-phosphate/fructose-6-phosphate phosphoketolase